MVGERFRHFPRWLFLDLPGRIWVAANTVYYHHEIRYHAWDQTMYRLGVRVVVSFVMLVLLALAIYCGRAGYRQHEEMLNVQKARECLARGDYQNASRNAEAALTVNRADLAACRVMAEIGDRTHSSAALDWRQRTANIAPTLENKLSLARASLQYQPSPFPLATEILNDLAASATTNADYQEISGDLAAKLHRSTEAEAHFEAAVKLDPGDQAYALNLAVFRLSLAKNEEKARTRQQIEELTTNADLRPMALRALVADAASEGDESAAIHYSTQLLATPQASMPDRLQSLEILQQFRSSLFSASLLAVERESETNPPDVADISAWMRAHGLLAESIRWLSLLPNGLLARPSVESALALSYLQTGNWQSLLDFGSRGDWEDMDYLRLAMVSRAWSHLGMATLAESNWGEAVRKASDHFETMTNLLELARQWQLKPEEDDLRQRVQQFAR